SATRVRWILPAAYPPGLLSRLAVEVQAVVERLQADPQDVRRLPLVPAVHLQGRHDEPALHLGDRGPDLQMEAAQPPRVAADLPGEAARADLLFRHDEGPVDHVLELADVPRPGVTAQTLHGLVRKDLGGAVTLVQLAQEAGGEELHVVAPF